MVKNETKSQIFDKVVNLKFLQNRDWANIVIQKGNIFFVVVLFYENVSFCWKRFSISPLLCFYIKNHFHFSRLFT